MDRALPTPARRPDHDKDRFMRTVVRELAGILEETVGERDAEAYVNYVGLVIGRSINAIYRDAFEIERLDLMQVASTLVDLKSKIDGGFTIESVEDDRIVLVNTRCPFGEKVVGRPSLCRMTANVFGSVAAENLGYARVKIDESIARGDKRCRVEINLVKCQSPPTQETEFFGTE